MERNQSLGKGKEELKEKGIDWSLGEGQSGQEDNKDITIGKQTI